MGAYNWDALGLTPSKPRPRLADLVIEPFQASIDWIKERLFSEGYYTTVAAFDCVLERWCFYQPDGRIAAIVPHDTVERVFEFLRKRSIDRTEGLEPLCVQD